MAPTPALADSVPRRIVATSLLALGLVALLAVLTFAMMRHVAARQALYAEVETTVQGVRMGVQRTALLAARRLGFGAVPPQPFVDDRLFAELHELDQLHAALLAGPAMRALPKAARRAYTAPPRRVDRAVERQLLALRNFDATPKAQLHVIVDDASASLLYGLDQVAHAHLRAERAEMARLRRYQDGLLFATLALLALEVGFVFLPMARRVRGSLRELVAVYEAYRRLSQIDELTGLDNRKALLQRLAVPLTQPHALLQIDLDHFKTVNDSLGHAVGDAVLVAVAEAIRDSIRPHDLAVRLGGDEFAVLLDHDVSALRATTLANALIHAIDAGCPEDALRAGLAASIGIAVYPDGDDDSFRLMGNADIALYEAKSAGRHRWCLFTPQMRSPLEDRQVVEVAFRQALLRGEIVLHYQPQIDLVTGAVVGLEALARWQRPTGEILGADRFVPYVEGGPLILEAGRRWLDVAVAFQLELKRLGLEAGPIAINVADLQLRQPDYAMEVLARLAAAGLGPEAIAVEIVERAFVARGQELIAQQLRTLADGGVAVELDDFGTGHASLTHLKAFPVSRIKIDRSFVDGIGQDASDETIVRATIDIAKSMGRRVVAEGIETEAQRRFLVDHGCVEGQGYLIARPMPPERLIDWLRAHHATPSRPARAAVETAV